jgi:hypothetical protein
MSGVVMNIVVDRIEDGLAVLEVGGTYIDFPAEALPEGCKEGDMLAFVTLDATEILAKATDRISRMRNMSSMGSGDIEI